MKILFTFFIFLNLNESSKKNYFQQKIPNSDLSIDMILIPEGKLNFNKNFSADSLNDSSFVSLSSFYISQFEITWDIYQLFMDEEYNAVDSSFIRGNEILKIDGISGPTTPYIDMSLGMGLEGYPAVNMTHYAASKFCEWLSSITGNYFRLPTEAEWEYASIGRNDTFYLQDDTIFSIADKAWFEKNSNNKYHKVGVKKPNSWGLYDMFGNVSEWVADSYVPQSERKLINDPFEFNESKHPKVYKGGSWKDDSTIVNSYSRMFSNTRLQRRDPQIPKSKWWNTDAPFLGFRVVSPTKIESDEIKFRFWNY